MTHLLFLFSVFGIVLSVMGLLGSVMLTRTSRDVNERLLELAQPGSAASEPERSMARKLFDGVRWLRSWFGMKEDAALLQRFESAGLRSPTARDAYFAARLLGPIVGVFIGSFFSSHKTVAMSVFGGILYLGPDIILTRLGKRYRLRVQKSIPDAIDLLVICVDAGLGMDQAMLRVSQELGTSHPQIYQEFMQINREQRAGKLRLEAWRSMAKRISLPEIDGFVNMLMQNERFGTPIARALSSYGDGIRQKRRQRAEELAAKTTVKIIFPLVFCIFPSMFIVLLGPAGITIVRGFKGGLP